ncbi:C4-dicarboxylate ABC transporter permease [Clostridiales bacterium PH28_bin88]|nr:C4-dicarboxylate ABC transporter permease [Clostridiales bacterium PH28_bin88]
MEKALYNPDQAPPLLRLWRMLVALLAIGLAGYVIYSAGFGGLPAWQHRGLFTAVGLVLCFSWIPYKKGNNKMHPVFDVMPLVMSVGLAIFILGAYPEISLREGSPSTLDLIAGTLMIVLVIEGVRRSNGLAMTIIAVFFLAYIFLGPWFPGLLSHPGFTYTKMIDSMFITSAGIFGAPIYVASTVLIMFLLFCSLLLRTGAGQFFIEFAFSLTGTVRGGPALAAVLSSALVGTITGNGAANATMTGSFTIPLMKKVGYRPEFAAGVEATASQGGQIMPPIMGAAAFIMAEYIGIPYIKIAGYAAIPAVLYFLVAGVVIYLQARKRGLTGLPREQLPSFGEVMLRGGYLLLPLIMIIALMIMGYSPMMAGLWALLVTFGLSFIRKATRMSFVGVLAALEDGVRDSIVTTMACAGAGIITGAVMLTGLGIRFSRLAVELSGGELLPMLFMIMVASLILGMGMPTVSAYVVLATVASSALVKVGVPVLAAHLFVFYFGIVSGITPPVAITSYVAAGIAKADPVKASFQAFRIAIAGFLLPYMFVYNPALLLQGDVATVVRSTVTAIVGLVAFASVIQGYLLHATPIWQRLLLLVSAITLVDPGLTTDLVGIAPLVIVVAAQWINEKKRANTPTLAEVPLSD